MDTLIAPYGGTLVDGLVDPARAAALKAEAFHLPSLDLDWHALADLELLLCGAYSPLSGYMTRATAERVSRTQTLDDGTFWPSPLTLTTQSREAAGWTPGMRVALRDGEGFMLAVLTLADVWQDDAGLTHLGGAIEGIALPPHADFVAQRATPHELRALLARRGWGRVIAWQAREPMHRAQYEFCLRCAIENESNLLLQPMVGGDLAEAPGYFAVARAFLAIRERFPAATTQLAFLPMAPVANDDAGIALRAIVARNYGASALIVGGEYTPQGAARRSADRDLERIAARVGVQLIAYPRMVYVEDRAEYLPEDQVPPGARVLALSGDEFRRRMQAGLKIPDWYSFPEVLAELARVFPSRDKQGFTVFFTGLSGAGKSTIARALAARLMETGRRAVTLLDGDIVRRNLSSELGFSRAHRDINVRRIGFVASEITKNGGVAICAPIAPYRQTRRDVRAMIEAVGGFVEVHVATPIETCEARDRKGLYAKARAGLIPEFTGVSDPYEAPENPELAIDTTDLSIDEAVQRVLLKLEHEGYLR